MALITTMCKLLLALAAGFYLYKRGIFNKEINSKLSLMITQITNPLLIVYSVSKVAGADVNQVLKLFFCGLCFYCCLVGIAWIYTRLCRIKPGMRGTYMCVLIFANVGFMGYPVVASLYGDSAIFYSSIFNMPFNLFIYTLGDYLIRKDAAISGADVGESSFSLRKIFSTGVIASIIALVIFFTQVKIPDAFYTCIGFLGDVTIPLSMVIIGSSLAAAGFSELKSAEGIFLLLPARFIILPAFTWLFMHLFIDDIVLISLCTMTIAMPVGTLTSMLSTPYPKQAKASSIYVVATTLVSVIVVPIMSVILKALGA